MEVKKFTRNYQRRSDNKFVKIEFNNRLCRNRTFIVPMFSIYLDIWSARFIHAKLKIHRTQSEMI